MRREYVHIIIDLLLAAAIISGGIGMLRLERRIEALELKGALP